MPGGTKRATRAITIAAVVAVFLAIALPVAIVALALTRSYGDNLPHGMGGEPAPLANVSILIPFFVACVVLAGVVLTAVMLRANRKPPIGK